MVLKHVVSYEWRGNVLVLLLQNNAVQMMQLHSNRMEVTMAKPVGLVPTPPDIDVDCAAISMSDQSVIIVHADGSRRVLELRDSVEVAAALDKDKAPPIGSTPGGAPAVITAKSEEEKGKTFLPEVPGTTAPVSKPTQQRSRYVRSTKSGKK
jgi:hypothetical protein